MASVFIATHGCYSDYSIDHVFSNRELCEKWCADREEFNVEEHELDPRVDFTENVKKSVGVDMLKDGNVKNVRNDGYGSYDKEARVRIWKIYHRIESNPYRTIKIDPDDGYLETIILTTDRDVAIKSTNEIRTRLIALGRWPSGDYRVVDFNYETLEETGRM